MDYSRRRTPERQKIVPKMTKRVPDLQGQVLEKAHPGLSFPQVFIRGNLYQERQAKHYRYIALLL